MPDDENTTTETEPTADDEPQEMQIIREGSDRARTSMQEEIDYIDADGNLHLCATQRLVMITDAEDLEALPEGVYPPGSVAFTADESGKWRLDASGTWNSLVPDPTDA